MRLIELPVAYRSSSPTLHEQPVRVVRMRGDGNCMFRALAHPEEKDYPIARHMVVKRLAKHWDSYYKDYVEEEHRDGYLEGMARDGTWGGQLELQAFCNAAKCPVQVFLARDPSKVHTVYGASFHGTPKRLLYDGAHYDAFH